MQRLKIAVLSLSLTLVALPASAADAPPPVRSSTPKASSGGGSSDLGLGTIRKDRTFGIGLGAGTLASGLSGKYFMSDSLSLQGNLGVWGCCGYRRWGYYGGAAASIDVLLEMPAIGQNEIIRVGWAIGAGVGLGVSDFADALGIAGAFVAGLELELQPLPIDFVIEWRPKLGIFANDRTGGVDFDLIDFTAHLRFYIL